MDLQMIHSELFQKFPVRFQKFHKKFSEIQEVCSGFQDELNRIFRQFEAVSSSQKLTFMLQLGLTPPPELKYFPGPFLGCAQSK